MQISERQQLLLRRVVEVHVELGQPVGSRWLAEQGDMPWGPSTIRAEMARLEELGLLQHPHTSAGRVPTDRGYREYVDSLMTTDRVPARAPKMDLHVMRHEVEEAMRATTEQLSQVNNLLAIVSAPPIGTTTIRHIEVLLLQPQVAMVVVITSTGGVTKRVISYDRPVDQGLVKWAGSYLNEVLGGMGLGARMLQKRLFAPGLSDGERRFLQTLAPAFTELEDTAEDTLFVGGAERLLTEGRLQELSQIGDLMTVLERRVALLGMLRSALEEHGVYLRIGAENETPELRSVSVVAANYGLPQRNLGAVSVLGPVRMDYPKAIASVREAAAELSRFVSELYGE
ncbi:MAG: heat-inducible transcriptional repressor [Thermoleophilaceae bacterium]|nr:heat-inducible transcriptional repressor [Thermoleophilaceae bacterium]